LGQLLAGTEAPRNPANPAKGGNKVLNGLPLICHSNQQVPWASRGHRDARAVLFRVRSPAYLSKPAPPVLSTFLLARCSYAAGSAHFLSPLRWQSSGPCLFAWLCPMFESRRACWVVVRNALTHLESTLMRSSVSVARSELRELLSL
jgi:hypothetical protein